MYKEVRKYFGSMLQLLLKIQVWTVFLEKRKYAYIVYKHSKYKHNHLNTSKCREKLSTDKHLNDDNTL
jgi:hypothetical protein